MNQFNKIDIKALATKTIQSRIFLHCIFWIAMLAYSRTFYSFQHTDDDARTMMSLIQTPLNMVFVYTVLYILIPWLLLRKRYVIFVILFILIGYINVRLTSLFLHLAIPFDAVSFNISQSIGDALSLLSTYHIAILASAIKLWRIWVKNNREAQQNLDDKYQAELKLKEAELSLLIAQIHPHFLFNTLNNLYGLTLDKSDKAPDVVLKISALLDYILYRCNTPTVLLKNEIEHLRTYMELEKLRYENDLEVILTQTGVEQDIQIAPLLLLPFVENSFKHSTSNSSNKHFIKINIDVKPDRFQFSVVNSIDKEKKTETRGYTKGIGLNNVKKRLELSYKDRYTLDIKDNEQFFIVDLKIVL